MSDENLNDVKRLLRWASLLAAITIMAIVFDRLTGCSTEVSRKIEAGDTPTATGTDTDTEVSCDGGLEPGQTREDACPGGKIVWVCSPDGSLKKAVETCNTQPPSCGPQAATFAAVQPILTRSCNGCHRGYDEYDRAKEKSGDYLRRFRLGINEPGHMPKGSALTAPEIDTFADWISDGHCPKPQGGGEPTPGIFYSLDETEQAMLSDLTDPSKVEVNDRVNVRYLLATDLIDAGATVEMVKRYGDAARKAVNSVSTERVIEEVVEVAPGVWRFRLDRIGLDAAEWGRIEAADLVNIESNTSKGQLLKLLTGARKPWLHLESFTDVTLRNAAVYYDLIETPPTFDALVAQIGVNYARDLAARRDVILTGFVGSPLSPHNRMASVHTRSSDGSLWCTYDSGLQDSAEKNYFNFPLLGDIGGRRNGQFVAGECIYTLPNGLHGYALFNARQTFNEVEQGGVKILVFVRSDLDRLQNVAPVGVVRDFLNPVSSEIAAGVSCFRCHAPGILPMRDQIRSHVIANGAQFGADKDLILKVYKPQPEMDAAVRRENNRYQGVLKTLGLPAPESTPDPISVAQDAHLLPWSFEKVCGTLWLRAGDCRVLLNQSATAQSQWGQLLSGSGQITFDQFIQSVQKVIADLRLFEDPL